MSVLPENRTGLPPTETLLYAGWLKNNYANNYVGSIGSPLLAPAATYTGSWEDVSGYCELRLLSISAQASAVGGVHVDWSMDGITQHATEAAGTALAATLYDSGLIGFHMPYVRVRYVNGGVQQTTFILRLVVSPTSIAGGGGGGAGLATEATQLLNQTDLNALATYLPGTNLEFYGPVGPLVAATPTLLMATPAGVTGGYYAVTIDPLAGPAEARVRTLWSRPVALTNLGVAFNNATYVAGVTVKLIGITLAGGAVLNVAVGQFIYNATNDGAAQAQLVTNIADNGADIDITLAVAYAGTAGAAKASGVCGVATAVYPTVPPQSDGGSPVVYGPMNANDVIILYADVAYAGGTAGATRAS